MVRHLLRRECHEIGRKHVDTLMARIGIEALYRKPRIDNVFIERLGRSVKHEEAYLKAYESIPGAKRQIGAYIELYNRRRRIRVWTIGRPMRCSMAGSHYRWQT